MPQAISIALKIITFFATNKDTIKQIILDIEALMPESPGNSKAALVKSFIATAMSIETQIEQVWPYVSPIFNMFVGLVKNSK